jgi:hypothetical protein
MKHILLISILILSSFLISCEKKLKQTYVGEKKNGNYHGQGTLTFGDGAEYVGEFKDGIKHGQGTFTYPDGEKYEGMWKDDQKNGQGTNTWSNGHKLVGNYKDGIVHGQGTYIWSDGRKYVGEFKDNVQNGQGTFTNPDGLKYIGEWKNGNYHGQGTETKSNGFKYVGEWKDGKTYTGTSYKPDGSIEGEFLKSMWTSKKDAIAKKKAEKEKAIAKKKAEKEKAIAKKKAEKEKAIAKKKVEKEKAIAKKKAEKERATFFPVAQKELIKIVMDFGSQFRKQETEIRKTQTRIKRSTEIKKLIVKRGSGIKKWKGVIVSVETDKVGDVSVEIKLDDKKVEWVFGNPTELFLFHQAYEGIIFRNDEKYSSGSNKIKSNSPNIENIADLKTWDHVFFSGRFITSGESLDFIKEFSSTEDGAMKEPEFAVVFSDIKKL